MEKLENHDGCCALARAEFHAKNGIWHKGPCCTEPAWKGCDCRECAMNAEEED